MNSTIFFSQSNLTSISFLLNIREPFNNTIHKYFYNQVKFQINTSRQLNRRPIFTLRNTTSIGHVIATYFAFLKQYFKNIHGKR